MKNLNKAILTGAISAVMLGGMTSNVAMADNWFSRAEDKAKASMPPPSGAKPVQQAAATDNSLVKHKVADNVTAGERLSIKTKIDAKNGVKLARVYFKAADAEKYSFVVLNKGERGVYTADIPAASNSVSAIEYKIVVQNAFGEIYKTEKYAVMVTPTDTIANASADAGFIEVYSEYPQDEADTKGFVDQVRYTYGATKIATQVGQALSVGGSSSGYVGGSSTASGAASTSAATTAASSTSITTAATVGAGAVGATAVTDPSGVSGDCFDGILEGSFDGYSGGGVDFDVWIELREGKVYAFSEKSSVHGCLDVSSDEVYWNEDETDYSGFCYTNEIIDQVISGNYGDEVDAEVDGEVSWKRVSSHGCSSVFYF